MQTGEWIIPGQLNNITYKIKLPNGEIKEGPLRFTVSQKDRFDEFIKKQKEESFDNVKLAHIALNPVGDKEVISIEEIKESLDLDQINLLGQMWLERKIRAPKITPQHDPKWF